MRQPVRKTLKLKQVLFILVVHLVPTSSAFHGLDPVAYYGLFLAFVKSPQKSLSIFFLVMVIFY